MDELPKKRKRIVSKGEYVAKTGMKATLSSFGIGIFILGLFCTAVTCFAVLPLLWPKGLSNIFACEEEPC